MFDTLHSEDAILPRVLQCWGKTGKEVQSFHPALYHMLDVGHVAGVLLSDPASPRWRSILADAFAARPEILRYWLPWVVAMHDVGKLSDAFQGQVEAQQRRMTAEGFQFGKRRDRLPHALVSQVFFEDSVTRLPKCFKLSICAALGGHHGQYNTSDAIGDTRDILAIYESAEWHELRTHANAFLQGHFLQQLPEALPDGINISTAAAVLTGFMIVCDWIGSDGRFFTPQPTMPPSDYIAYSTRQARMAVEAAGFLQQVASDAPASVGALFHDLGSLRPLQSAIDTIPEPYLSSPLLAIIEAPTGEGKTEAALALAHRIGLARHTDEMYYALPTMATSNQMYKRLQKHLHDRLGLPALTKLVHGQAFLIEDDLRIELMSESGDITINPAMEWFGSKKRALLAPFGVGTIDQAELAALNARHSALRLAGLAGKVVIIDEVHAYDTYMTTIIERLLSWLNALGSSVILLSATLPLSRRRALARAYGVRLAQDDAGLQSYPSLLLAGQIDGEAAIHAVSPLAWQPNKELNIAGLNFSDDEAEAKAEWLLAQVKDGGCACWITNTVARAQQIFKAVYRLAGDDVDRQLLHAQFPLEDRQTREQALTSRYGKDSQRPTRGVVIGTQVLEQSLDLDFDVMVSDLAPIDLLLQRAGRMHRHDRARPAAHAAARLYVNTALHDAEDEITLGADSAIYDEYVLRLSWLELCKHPVIRLPYDYRVLIEQVYSELEPPESSKLHAVWEKLQNKQSSASAEARQRLLPRPDPEELFSEVAAGITFEENENSAAWIVAQTRLGEESLNIIPLELMDDATCIGPGGEPLRIDRAPVREVQLWLLRRGLRISRKSAVAALKQSQQNTQAPFGKAALLRDHVIVWLHGGQAIVTTGKSMLRMTLDPRLGLVIETVDGV